MMDEATEEFWNEACRVADEVERRHNNRNVTKTTNSGHAKKRFLTIQKTKRDK